MRELDLASLGMSGDLRTRERLLAAIGIAITVYQPFKGTSTHKVYTNIALPMCSHHHVCQPAGFENLALRSSGQVAAEVKSYRDILELTLKAWKSLDYNTLAAAWVSCGYMDYRHMDAYNAASARELVQDAQTQLSDLFSPLGRDWSPQRCLSYEWQIQDRLIWLYILHYRFSTNIALFLILGGWD